MDVVGTIRTKNRDYFLVLASGSEMDRQLDRWAKRRGSDEGRRAGEQECRMAGGGGGTAATSVRSSRHVENERRAIHRWIRVAC